VRSAERAIAAGIAGINLEDFDPQTNDVIAIEAHVARIAAIKARADALGTRLFVNARTDLLLYDLGDDEPRVERTIERLRAYAAAGADGVFAPGVSDPGAIERIATAVDAPLNVLAGTETARVSIGSAGMQRALGALASAAEGLHGAGTFGFLRERRVPYGEMNDRFRERERKAAVT
jgi:2-methylisocitrate lyase-like PEP mutase family enzyme